MDNVQHICLHSRNEDDFVVLNAGENFHLIATFNLTEYYTQVLKLYSDRVVLYKKLFFIASKPHVANISIRRPVQDSHDRKEIMLLCRVINL